MQGSNRALVPSNQASGRGLQMVGLGWVGVLGGLAGSVDG